MTVIPPYKISSEIVDVLYSANSYAVLISPYVDFENWPEFKFAIENALKRGVEIIFYVRAEPENFKSWQQIENYGIKPRLVDKLHAKLYFNETKGVIASMNLLTSSKLSAVEFGMLATDPKDLQELTQFTKQFLNPNCTASISEEDVAIAEARITDYLDYELRNKLPLKVYTKFERNSICVKGKYWAYLSLDFSRQLTISIILNHREMHSISIVSETNKFISLGGKFSIEPLTGTGRWYNQILFTSNKTFTTDRWNKLKLKENKIIGKNVAHIIDGVYKFKDYVYECRKNKENLASVSK